MRAVGRARPIGDEQLMALLLPTEGERALAQEGGGQAADCLPPGAPAPSQRVAASCLGGIRDLGGMTLERRRATEVASPGLSLLGASLLGEDWLSLLRHGEKIERRDALLAPDRDAAFAARVGDLVGMRAEA